MCVNLGFKENGQGEDQAEILDNMRAYAGTYYLNTLSVPFPSIKSPQLTLAKGVYRK